MNHTFWTWCSGDLIIQSCSGVSMHECLKSSVLETQKRNSSGMLSRSLQSHAEPDYFKQRGWWKIKDNAHSDNPTKLCSVSGEWGGSWKLERFKESFGQLRQNSVLLQGGFHCYKEEMESRGVLVCPTRLIWSARQGEYSFGKKTVRTPNPPVAYGWGSRTHACTVHTHSAEAMNINLLSYNNLNSIQEMLFYEVNQGYAVL